MAGKFQPYVGPRPFERRDHDVFFGRDYEINELVSLVIAHDVVLLYAQSGAGKTSLVNAGLIPRLEEEGAEVLPVARVGGRRPANLDARGPVNVYVFSTLASWDAGKAEADRPAERSLAARLAATKQPLVRGRLPSPRVAIFDQFEELFSSHQDRWADREGFFKQVVEALDGDSLLRVVFVIREDYIAQLDPYVPLLRGRLRTRYRLERLRAEGARQALEGPLARTERSFGKGVAQTLVQQLLKIKVKGASENVIDAVGEYVEPVQLQVVCDRLWRHLPPDVREITSDYLQQFGDVEEALTDFYVSSIEAVEKKTDDPEGALRKWFDEKLITPGGTRGTVFRGKDHTEGISNAAVDVLEDQHIIRAEVRAGARWYELTHDRLIEPIRKSNFAWFQHQRREEQERKIEVVRKQAEEQRQRADEQAATARRLRRLTAALIAMCLVAVAAAVFGLSQKRVAEARQQETEKARDRAIGADLAAQESAKKAIEAAADANEQREIALARQLAAQSELMLGQHAGLLTPAVLLAVESMRRTPSLEADQALRHGLALLPRPVAEMGGSSSGSVVAFSPKGKHLATVRLGDVYVWDATNGKEVARMRHQEWLAEESAIVFSSDEKYLATGSTDRIVRIWEVNTRRMVASLSHKSEACPVAFTPDGNYLITKELGGPLAHTWDTANQKEVAQVDHGSPIGPAALRPGGRHLATASGSTVRLWDVTDGTKVADIEVGSYASISAIAFSSNGDYLATASTQDARVWNVRDGNEVARMDHEDYVVGIAFNPSGKQVATTSLDDFVRVWDATNGIEILRMDHGNRVESLAFSPDGAYLVTRGRDDATARVWDTVSGRELRRINHEGDVSSVAFGPDSRCLATVTYHDPARVWDIARGQEVARLDHAGGVQIVVFTEDGKRLATTSDDHRARVWEVPSGKEVVCVRPDFPLSVAFSPDGKHLATADMGRTVRVWDVNDGAKIAEMKHETLSSRLSCMAFNGRHLATAGWDKTARVWDWAAQKEIARVTHEEEVQSVSFSPDGRYLATASSDKTARVWDWAAQKEIARMPHEHEVTAAVFSPDGRYVATIAELSEPARLWNAATGEQVAQMQDSSYQQSIAFSFDGKYLAGIRFPTIQIWEAISGDEIARMDHEDRVLSAAFSRDGVYLATASMDRTARVWRVTGGQEIARVNHDSYVTSVAFSPDGKYLAAASSDKTASVSLVLPKDLMAEACSRLSRNLTYAEWYRHFPDEPYRKTCESLPVHPSLFAAGRNLAEKGDIDGAVAIFRRALELEPGLPLEPEREARYVAARSLADQGNALVGKGNIRQAITAYQRARELDPALEISAASWNSLAWNGCLRGYAADVVDACQRAVMLAPDRGEYRDTRGLARALTRDYAGAIEDFQFYVDSATNASVPAESIRKRVDWIRELKAGRDPFDESTLAALRGK